MPTIFETRPGVAIALVDTSDVPLALSLDGWGGYSGFKSIITDISVSLDGNYQFLHTLQDLIFVYVFGDRISQIAVSGLAFAGTCPDGGPPSGIEHVLQYYENNRIANRATPVQLQIGTSGSGHFQGYLTGMKANIAKPEARICQFTLLLHVFPKVGQ